MKYVVIVNGTRIDVARDGDGIRVGDRLIRAHLADVDGTPVKVLRIGDAVHRVVMQRGTGRGQYTIWVGGHRYDVEALDERVLTKQLVLLTLRTRDQLDYSLACSGKRPTSR